MTLKALIFDLDGTLLDTLEDLAISANHVLSQFQKEPIEIQKYKYLVGGGAPSLMQNILKTTDNTIIEKALKLFEQHYATQFDKNTKIYEGIGKMLSFLQKRGYKLTVLSNKPNSFTKKCVFRYLRNWNFEVVYGIRENVPKKPSPQGAIEILKELHVEPKECIFIGDTKFDMITAKSANITSIGVLWGFRDEAELVDNGANFIAKFPSDVIKIVEKLTSKSR